MYRYSEISIFSILKMLTNKPEVKIIYVIVVEAVLIWLHLGRWA